ncbi:MAG: hypothetical protein JSR26_09265 [Proteobacteria bacterium]|nr:hypothetical protein [Pseudomonadota bacterium]
MSKATLLVLAAAFSLLTACGGSSTVGTSDGSDGSYSAASPSAASPSAASPNAAPSGITPDVVIGRWRGTGNPTACPLAELIIAHDSFVSAPYASVPGGRTAKFPVLGIAMQGDSGNEVSVMTNDHPDVYRVIDKNDIQLETPWGGCPYVRE